MAIARSLRERNLRTMAEDKVPHVPSALLRGLPGTSLAAFIKAPLPVSTVSAAAAKAFAATLKPKDRIGVTEP